jgi:hypothetical protein
MASAATQDHTVMLLMLSSSGLKALAVHAKAPRSTADNEGSRMVAQLGMAASSCAHKGMPIRVVARVDGFEVHAVDRTRACLVVKTES